jgi:predicted amidohydrolase
MNNKARHVQVAVAQMEMAAGRPEENISRALRLVGHAVAGGAQVILLPELFITGFDYECIADRPLRHTDACLRELRVIARNGGVVIVAGSVVTRSKRTFKRSRKARPSAKDIYNTCHVIGPDGRTKAVYHKLHPFPLMAEDAHFRPGTTLTTAKTDFGKIAPCICFDIRFPEVVRRLALLGTQILAVPAEFPHPRLDHWQTLLRARAIENQFFVVAANRVGHDETGDFFGHSMIVNPTGEVVAAAGHREEVLINEIDLGEIESARKAIPCLDRINPAVRMSVTRKSSQRKRRGSRCRTTTD